MAPLDQLPVLEIEEAHNRKLVVPQSRAILRYLGMLGGLYPEDPAEALTVDSMCACIGDALRQIEISMRSSSRSILEFKTFTDDECMDIRVRLAEDEERGVRKVSLIEVVERKFDPGRPCIPNENAYPSSISPSSNDGSRAIFPDLVVGWPKTRSQLQTCCFINWFPGSFGACLNGFMLDGFPNDIVIEYPLLQLHKERLEEIQQVESFRALHEHPYASFDFVPDVEVDVVKPGYTLPVSDIANLPRLTLTHMRDSRSADTIRIAAAIGKVRGSFSKSSWFPS